MLIRASITSNIPEFWRQSWGQDPSGMFFELYLGQALTRLLTRMQEVTCDKCKSNHWSEDESSQARVILEECPFWSIDMPNQVDSRENPSIHKYQVHELQGRGLRKRQSHKVRVRALPIKPFE
jgi:hypothetical protein